MVQDLSREDIDWLLNNYNKIRQYGKVSNWIDDHVRALQLLKGSWNKPGCNCEYVSTARIANSVYEQYEQQLKDQLFSYENAHQQGSSGIAKGRTKKIEG